MCSVRWRRHDKCPAVGLHNLASAQRPYLKLDLLQGGAAGLGEQGLTESDDPLLHTRAGTLQAHSRAYHQSQSHIHFVSLNRPPSLFCLASCQQACMTWAADASDMAPEQHQRDPAEAGGLLQEHGPRK